MKAVKFLPAMSAVLVMLSGWEITEQAMLQILAINRSVKRGLKSSLRTLGL